MTEEQAKTKFCCRNPEKNCVGSACMAWRWDRPQMQEDYSSERPDWDPPFGPWEMNEFGNWQSSKPVTGGYCGLAGKP